MENRDNKEKFWAGGFLYNPKENAVFLHKRDGNTKFNPNMWAFFGGLNEGPEEYVDTFVRELEEEIGIKIEPSDVRPLCQYMNEELDTYRVVFYVESDVAAKDLTLGEGAGFAWVKIAELDTISLTEKTEKDLRFFLSEL